MRKVLLAGLALALGAGPGAAQVADDPMAEQRCVWACLANSPGADSAEYSACVREYCEGPGPLAEPETPVTGEAGLAQSPRPKLRPVGSAATTGTPAPDGDPPPMPGAETVAAGWSFGPGAGGVGMYAGVIDRALGARLDWLCQKGRVAVLALSPYAGDGRVVATVDGRPREMEMTVENGAAYLPIALGDPLFLHIASGQEVVFASAAGTVLGTFAMTGAPLAIGQAEGRCH